MRSPRLLFHASQIFEESISSGSVYLWRRKAFGANTQEPCYLPEEVLHPGSYPGGVTLTGNVTHDFLANSPNVFVNLDLGVPLTRISGMTASGFDIIDVRYLYDSVRDVAYFGETAPLCKPRSVCVLL